MYTIPLDLIRIDPGGCHLMLHACINRYKANALIDTGASKTVMDISRANKYIADPVISTFDSYFTGMGTGTIKTWITQISRITIGNMELENQEIILIDMTPIHKSYARFDLPRIDLVIGGDLLLQMGAVIDYPNRKLIMTR